MSKKELAVIRSIALFVVVSALFVCFSQLNFNTVAAAQRLIYEPFTKVSYDKNNIDNVSDSIPSINYVSGNITDGEVLTIYGSEFGTHPDYDVMGTDCLCSWWDDFDEYSGLSSGDNPLSNKYTWSDAHFSIATDEKRGSQSIRKIPDTSSSKLRPKADPYDTNGKWYTSFWHRLPENYSLDNTGGTHQWKIIRFFGPNGDGFYPGYARSSDNQLGHHSDSSNGDIGRTKNWFKYGDVVQGAPWRGTWHRIEIYTDTANDEHFYKIDGHIYYDGNSFYGSNLFDSGWNNSVLKYFSIDEVCSAGPNNWGWFDDIYVSNTWARVEISQTNEFTTDTSKRLIKNIQIPLSWNDNEIKVRLNLEGLSGQIYLFVVDAEGKVSKGYPLTIQGSGTSSVCGNGIIETGEECDDGNTISGDGCFETSL